MVFQKLRHLLVGPESKDHKPSSVSINIIGGQSFQNADVTYGIVNLTENISAAVVRLCPPGTHKKSLKGKPFKIENMKGAIIEISTEAKYDYKETGMWSKWPDPRTLHYSELTSNTEQHETISSEVPCQVLVLIPPSSTKIDFENELVYNFFKKEFLNKLVRTDDEKNEFLNGIGIQSPHEWSNIVLQIAGQNLSFGIGYAYPYTTSKVDENTHISYIIPEDLPSNYKLKMFKFLPEEFRKKFLADIPFTIAETIRISEDKSYDAFIEQMNYIKQMRKEFQESLGKDIKK